MNDCPGCGSGSGPLVPSAACRTRFEEVLAREFGDPAWFAPHHLTVPAYRLQHPDEVNDRTLATMVLMLGEGLETADVAALRRHVGRTTAQMRRQPAARPAAPAHRGTMTVGDILAARTPGDHERLVREWAADVAHAWGVIRPRGPS